MFTAIVLSKASRAHLLLVAGAHFDLSAATKVYLDHCTLAMGISKSHTRGEERTLTVTHIGQIAGRVCAFRVSGADDSKNKVPHVTIATFGDAKPKESNEIQNWEELPHPLTAKGTVQIRIA